jgi:hypothetical protein
MRWGLLLGAALAGAAPLPSAARASHCPALTRGFDEIKRLDAAVDAADAADDMEKACTLQQQRVALMRKLLKEVDEACFHGRSEAFASTIEVSTALEELYCNWDEADDFLFDDEEE